MLRLKPGAHARMSLRAKIEAVIYAAEEPVTLQQLLALFAPEVRLEMQQDMQQDMQQELDRTREASPDGAASEITPAEPYQESELVGEAESARAAESAEHSDSAAPEPTPASEAAAAPLPLAAEDAADTARRQAKLEERELRDGLRRILDQLIADFNASDRGMEIREIAGGYRMATRPEYHDAVRAFVRSLKPPMKLTLQALETLAVVAYKQPVTGPEISEIRGVESAGVLGSLMGRKLITTAGRKPVIGRPILYKTTKDFLLRFGLKDLNELPSIEEFEKMAGELAEGDAEVDAAQANQNHASEPGQSDLAAGTSASTSDGETGDAALETESTGAALAEGAVHAAGQAGSQPEADPAANPDADRTPDTDNASHSTTEQITTPEGA